MAEFEGIDCSHLGEEWPKFPLRFPTLEQTVGGTNRAELFEADIRGTSISCQESADSERGDGPRRRLV